ncbi:MAG: hypothetical protein JXJ19_06305 [Elusimicrobia bacterium]|nr:hypothetical protein [Elusimicrobiota bacterium]
MNIKKIFAREWLIIVLFIFIGVIIFTISYYYPGIPEHKTILAGEELVRLEEIQTQVNVKRSQIKYIGIAFPFFAYFIYWLIRSIFWAFRTIKEK